MISRRNALGFGAVAALGVGVGVGVGVGFGARERSNPVEQDTTPVGGRSPGEPAVSPSATPQSEHRLTVETWRRSRRSPYFIAHRGAGAVVPEHTFPAYQRALTWGADCLEISVVKSLEGELYCLHDLTLARTTTLLGPAASKSASQLDAARVDVPRLGPGWSGSNRPRMPRLIDVLNSIGGSAVLCIEAKDDDAYPLILDAIAAADVVDSIMIKVDAHSPRLQQAKDDGYPVFAYIGDPAGVTATAIDGLAALLDRSRDVMVLPADADGEFLSAELIRHAVDTGIPVWVFPVARRSEVQHFAALGVEGIVTPDIGYLSRNAAQTKKDTWSRGRISAGELTLDPYSDQYGLQWDESAVVTLAATGRPAFLTLGQFCPIEATSYRIEFEARWNSLPDDALHIVSIAFCHDDDRYYEHQSGTGDGYHGLLSQDGTIALYAHLDGRTRGQFLGDSDATPAASAGHWIRFLVEVSPERLRWGVEDRPAVEVRDQRFRGGYFHIGRPATSGTLSLRHLRVQ
ncbi:MAG TPA: glycerophosphodiester phosphodiesterase [Microlunatus sp.]